MKPDYVEKYSYEEVGQHKATMRLPYEHFPDLGKEVRIVITYDGDNVFAAVKAPAYEFSVEDGVLTAAPFHVGDHCILPKTATIEEFFNGMKTAWKNVTDMIEASKNGTLDELLSKNVKV